MKEHKVYHIHNCDTTDITRGYIGVTSNLKARLRSHKHSGVLRANDVCTILFTGLEFECYVKEEILRPIPGIGRNKGQGGYLTAGHIQVGQRLSVATEIKKGERKSIPTEFKKGRVPHNKGKGKDYLFTNPDGKKYIVTCITDFCKTWNLTPANMRKVARGERNFHKGWKASVLTGRKERR